MMGKGQEIAAYFNLLCLSNTLFNVSATDKEEEDVIWLNYIDKICIIRLNVLSM